MMGLSVAPPSQADIVAMASQMALPAAAKRTLADIGQQLDALNRRREEIAALQKQADVDRAAIDKRAAEIEQRAAVLDAANAKRATELSKRTAALNLVLGELENKLTATLEQLS
jgi:hypothetical protein